MLQSASGGRCAWSRGGVWSGGWLPGPGGAWSGGVVCSGGCLVWDGWGAGLGMCLVWRGCLLPGGCLLEGVCQHALRQTPLLPVDRHMPVKILPLPNFVVAGNNSFLSKLREWYGLWPRKEVLLREVHRRST